MFRIGEFSKIAQVPASQLRYYDEIGLFTPIQTDPETSYRYYSVQQLAALNRILALKDLGLLLEQIKRLVEEEVSPEEIRGMLALRKAQIEQTLQSEAMRLQAVELRLQQLERQGQLQDDDVVLKPLPAQPFLSLRQTCHELSETFAIVSGMSQAVLTQVKPETLGRFAAVIHSEVYDIHDLDIEFGFLLNHHLDAQIPLSDGLVMKVRELPSIETAVTSIRFGGPEKGLSCYNAIGIWAETNQYQLMMPGREVFIVPPQIGHESEMVVEIQFPVKANPA